MTTDLTLALENRLKAEAAAQGVTAGELLGRYVAEGLDRDELTREAGLGTRIARRFAAIGGADLDFPARSRYPGFGTAAE